MTGQDVQLVEEAFFDTYVPAGARQHDSHKLDIDDRTFKQQRRELNQRKGGQGRSGRGKGRSDTDPNAHQGQDERGSGSQRRGHKPRRDREDDSRELEELRASILSLQRLTLRHEDSLGMIQSEYSFVAFLRVASPSSVVPALYSAQRAWRDLRDSDPAKITKPMRCSLLTCLFKELSTGMRGLDTEEDNKSSLKKLGWITEDQASWNFVQWSAEQKRLLADATRAPMKRNEAIALVDRLIDMVGAPGLVVRFHPTRPLTSNMAGESLTCCLQVSIREARAVALYDDLALLSGLACTQLIGMGLRKDRASRSALAQAIAKTM